jgi:hypothetical protein
VPHPAADSFEPAITEAEEADVPATAKPAVVSEPSVPETQESISDWVVDMSRFEAVGVIKRRSGLPNEILKNKQTGCRVAVKWFLPLDLSAGKRSPSETLRH